LGRNKGTEVTFKVKSTNDAIETKLRGILILGGRKVRVLKKVPGKSWQVLDLLDGRKMWVDKTSLVAQKQEEQGIGRAMGAAGGAGAAAPQGGQLSEASAGQQAGLMTGAYVACASCKISQRRKAYSKTQLRGGLPRCKECVQSNNRVTEMHPHALPSGQARVFDGSLDRSSLHVRGDRKGVQQRGRQMQRGGLVDDRATMSGRNETAAIRSEVSEVCRENIGFSHPRL
jgi:hypothetical protein